MSDDIPAKAEMLASDIDLVVSDPQWAAARLVYLESEVESLQRENGRYRQALEEIVKATPANRHDKWPHHHYYLHKARTALEEQEEAE